MKITLIESLGLTLRNFYTPNLLAFVVVLKVRFESGLMLESLESKFAKICRQDSVARAGFDGFEPLEGGGRS
jgi:hypothetical protein